MADPIIDLEKLGAVKDWVLDLIDELNRTEILPCKNVERLGDCLAKQKRFLVEEMKPSKMCVRCKARWFAMMALKHIDEVYQAKTNRDLEAAPDFS